jgi:hypothetical protein
VPAAFRETLIDPLQPRTAQMEPVWLVEIEMFKLKKSYLLQIMNLIRGTPLERLPYPLIDVHPNKRLDEDDALPGVDQLYLEKAVKFALNQKMTELKRDPEDQLKTALKQGVLLWNQEIVDIQAEKEKDNKRARPIDDLEPLAEGDDVWRQSKEGQ